MEINVIKKIIAILEESNLKKLHLRDGDFEISIEKHDSKRPPHEYKRESRVEKRVEEKTNQERVEDGDYITSPIVGTFYPSPAPDKPSFVKVGDVVDENTVVCIIEAMKVMNEVKANKKGKIVEIIQQNASPVEFGTNLFRIEL